LQNRGDGGIVFGKVAEGLNKLQAGKLFERFYTAETVRNSTGLGLLPIEQMRRELITDYKNESLSIRLCFGLA